MKSHIHEMDPPQGGPPLKKQRTISPTSLLDDVQGILHGDDDRNNYNNHFYHEGSPTAASPSSFMLEDECIVGEDDHDMNSVEEGGGSVKLILSECISKDGSESVVQKGLGDLWGLLGGGEYSATVTITKKQRRQDMLNLGGHWKLSEVMQEFPRNLSIQMYGCSILRELMLEGNYARYQVYASAGMDRTIVAMGRFPNNVHMQLCGCQFLSRLLLLPVSCAVLENLVRSTDGLRTILRLLQTQLCSEATNVILEVLSHSSTTKILRDDIICAIHEYQQTCSDCDAYHQLVMKLEDLDSESVRDEQYML